MSGTFLQSNKMWIAENDSDINENEIISSPSVGVEYAGEDAGLSPNNMKATPLLVFCMFVQLGAVAQSPFDYGQNKRVYFISTELRQELGFDRIYLIEKREDGYRGEWQVVDIFFDSTEVFDNWTPGHRDDTFEFNFDTLISNLTNRYGNGYRFSNKKLNIRYGFHNPHTIYVNFSDSVSIGTTFPYGRHGEIGLSKNIFDKKGKLNYRIDYPAPTDSANETIELVDWASHNAYLNSNVHAGNLPDTVYIKYNKRGMLLEDMERTSVSKIKDIKSLFEYEGEYPEVTFHQIYVGKIEMEQFFLEKLGYQPELVLIEIYRYGVFSFLYNPENNKYHRTREIIIER